MTRIYNNVGDWINDHIGGLLAGVVAFFVSNIMALFGYFTPLCSIFNVIFWSVVADLSTGVWASRKQGFGIKSKRLKKTVIKIGLYFGIVMLIYMVDVTFKLTTLASHIGFMIVAFEFYSVLENAAIIIDHPVFKFIKKLMRDKVEDVTGVNIGEDDDEKRDN